MSARDLHLGAVLDGRYRIDIVAPSSGSGSAYLATHLAGGEFVRLVEVPAAVASALGRATLLSHPALSTLLELLPMPGGYSFAVLEFVPGQTLEDELRRRGKLSTQEAVACFLAVAAALTALHERRAAHGLLRPASIVVNAGDRSTAVLSFAPPLAGPNPYECPERAHGAPSPTDDVWAVGASLYHALTGRPPPTGGLASAAQVRDLGVTEPWLVNLLAGCLARRPANRISLIRPVYDTLAACSAAVGVVLGPSPSASEPRSTTPRPLTAALRLPRAIGSSHRWWPVGAVLVAAVGGGLWLMRRGLSDTPLPPAPGASLSARPAPPAPAHPPPGAESPAETEAELIRVENLPSADELAACVIRQFPPGTFLENPNVDWLCSTTDPRKGVELMRSALVRGAGPNRLTEAMNVWSRLRWFGMAGFAVVRGSCCAYAAKLELPAGADCGPTASVIERLVEAVTRGEPHERALAEYRKHVACQSRFGRAAEFAVDTPLGGGQEQAFVALLAARPAR